MKYILFSLVCLFNFNVSIHSQNLFVSNDTKELRFQMKGSYSRAVKPEEIKNAKSIEDLINGYPKNWITEYTSVELIANCKGKEMIAVGKSDKLNAEQLHILNQLDVGNDLNVKIKYLYNDPVSKRPEKNNLSVSLAVIPEFETTFYGGDVALNAYVKENIISKISQNVPNQFQRGFVTFTVNEHGEVLNVKMKTSTGDIKSDAFIMDLVRKMPRWKPAEKSNGLKVEQTMQFSFGSEGC